MPKLHDLIDHIGRDRLFDPYGKSLSQSIRPAISWILTEARNAVCFDIGETRDIPQLKFIPALFHLPYPDTWLEGVLSDGILGILAVETGELQWDIAVFNKIASGTWALIGVYCFSLTGADGVDFFVESRVHFSDNAKDHVIEAVQLVLARFLMALNCTNTEKVEHPAPKFLNKERVKKGKQPIFSYWTLHLPGSPTSDVDHGGTHASPRIHLRRGHVRKYAEGKYTWVEACVVGNKSLGMVAKDYMATT